MLKMFHEEMLKRAEKEKQEDVLNQKKEELAKTYPREYDSCKLDIASANKAGVKGAITGAVVGAVNAQVAGPAAALAAAASGAAAGGAIGAVGDLVNQKVDKWDCKDKVDEKLLKEHVNVPELIKPGEELAMMYFLKQRDALKETTKREAPEEVKPEPKEVKPKSPPPKQKILDYTPSFNTTPNIMDVFKIVEPPKYERFTNPYEDHRKKYGW